MTERQPHPETLRRQQEAIDTLAIVAVATSTTLDLEPAIPEVISDITGITPEEVVTRIGTLCETDGPLRFNRRKEMVVNTRHPEVQRLTDEEDAFMDIGHSILLKDAFTNILQRDSELRRQATLAAQERQNLRHRWRFNANGPRSGLTMPIFTTTDSQGALPLQ